MDLDRVHQLQQQLRHQTAEARVNQEKMRRFQALELELLGRNGLPELFSALLEEGRNRFGLSHVTLVVHDPDHEYRRNLLRDAPHMLGMPRLQLIEDFSKIEALYDLRPYQPRLTDFRYRDHGHLFPGARGHDRPRSLALLPLVRRGELFGSMNLGSPDDRRYVESYGTEFLGHFAAIVSSCLENELNHERLRHLTLTDTLTGVSNRRFFDQRVLEEVAAACRHGDTLSMMFMDLDHFKQVNDNHGHQVGDYLLRDAAGIIGDQLRLGDTLSRFGGEEFVALLPRVDRDEASVVSERIRSSLEEYPFHYGEDHQLHITCSIGLTTFRPAGRYKDIPAIAERLLSVADSAVYKAKDKGRNRVVFLDPEIA